MIRRFEDLELSSDDSSVIEFRSVKVSPKVMQKVDIYDQKLIESYRSMSGHGGMFIIEESTRLRHRRRRQRSKESDWYCL